MASFDLKKYRDENIDYYGDTATLEDVAKDIYDRGGEAIHKGNSFEAWVNDRGLMDQFQAEKNERASRAEFKDRGVLRGLASDVAGGVVQAGETWGRALRAVTPQAGGLPDAQTGEKGFLTKGIEGIEKTVEQTPFLQEDPNQGWLGKAVHGGVRSAVSSLTSNLPAAGAGALAGAALGGGPVGAAIGAVAGFALSGGATFGLSQYDDVLQRADAKGIPRSESEPAAIREGIYEGGFEFASDLLTGWMMGAGKLLTAPAKQALKISLQDLTSTSLKEIGKRTAISMAGEVGGEMATAAGQAYEEKSLGLGDQGMWDAAMGAIGPSAVASLIFAGIGHVNTKVNQGRIMKALENPTADQEQRLGAAQEVYKALADYDETLANTWMKSANEAIAQGRSITTNDNILDLEQKVSNITQTPEKARTEAQKKNLASYTEQLNKFYSDMQTSPEEMDEELQYLEAQKRSAGPETDVEAINQRMADIQGMQGTEEQYQESRGAVQGQAAPPTEDESLDDIDAKVENLVRYGNRIDKELFNLQGDDSEEAQVRRGALTARQQEVAGRVDSLRTRQQDLMARKANDLPINEQGIRDLPEEERLQIEGPEDRKSLPSGQTFELKNDDDRAMLEEIDNRILQLTQRATALQEKMGSVNSETRRNNLSNQLKILVNQIDANKAKRSELVRSLTPNQQDEYQPSKSALDSAQVFEDEVGNERRLAQSPKGGELLRRELSEQEKIRGPERIIPPEKSASESADVFEDEAKKEERIIQSPVGAQLLRNDLHSQERGESPPPVQKAISRLTDKHLDALVGNQVETADLAGIEAGDVTRGGRKKSKKAEAQPIEAGTTATAPTTKEIEQPNTVKLYDLTPSWMGGGGEQKPPTPSQDQPSTTQPTTPKEVDNGQKRQAEALPSVGSEAQTLVEPEGKAKPGGGLSSSPPDFNTMVKEAARWRGAAINADQALKGDNKARLKHNNETTKGALDAHLMNKYGIDAATARTVSNELTAKNIPADRTAKIEDYAGQPWADRVLNRGKQEGEQGAVGSPVASHETTSGETQPALSSTGETQDNDPRQLWDSMDIKKRESILEQSGWRHSKGGLNKEGTRLSSSVWDELTSLARARIENTLTDQAVTNPTPATEQGSDQPDNPPTPQPEATGAPREGSSPQSSSGKGAAPLYLEDHAGGKSFLVKGDTKTHKDRIKGLGGAWNKKLGGWIFANGKRKQVEGALSDLLGKGEAKNPVQEGKTENPITSTPIPENSTSQNEPQGDKTVKSIPEPVKEAGRTEGDVSDVKSGEGAERSKKFKLGDRVTPVRDKDVLKPGVITHIQELDGVQYVQIDGVGKHWSSHDFELEATVKPDEKGVKSDEGQNIKLLDLSSAISKHFTTGNGFINIVDARKFASEILGEEIKPGTELAKIVDEYIEAGIVRAARELVQRGKSEGLSSDLIFDALVSLYNRQPRLGVRTSTSVEQQAYSTPVPIAFLASELAGINRKTKVYEPTAGTGALLLSTKPGNVFANELNPVRANILDALGFNVTRMDATELLRPPTVDVVIANPPFGRLKDRNGVARSWKIDNRYTTQEIDHAIALKSLEAMKPSGKAVLIIGGKQGDEQTKKQKYSSQSSRAFFVTLYGKYNVVDHFTISGDLYAKQGAGWPIDVIVIHGLGKSGRDLPSVTVPTQYDTFDSLKEKFNATPSNEVGTSVAPESGGDTTAEGRDRTSPSQNNGPGQRNLPGTADSQGQVDDRDNGSTGDAGKDSAGRRSRSETTVRDSRGKSQEHSAGSDLDTERPANTERLPGQSPTSESGNNGISEPDRGNGPRSLVDDADSKNQGVKGDVEAEIKGMSDGDISSLLDDVFGKEPEPKPAPPQPKTVSAPELVKKVGLESVAGVNDAIKGLGALFTPKSTLSSGGISFDEDTYASAKPHFEAAWAHAKEAGYTLKELVQHLAKQFDATIRPYLQRFLVDQANKTEEEPKRRRVDNSTAKSTKTQVAYTPSSKMNGLNTLTPVNLVEPIKNALNKISDEVGDLDGYVQRQLGYETQDELRKALSAEQVDAVAMAIYNFDKGSAFILGDQTGIGKGRVVASIIRYTLKQGKVPIFVSAAENLYSDMIRDLSDIGTTITPFITNGDLKGKKAIILPDGSKLTTPSGAKNKSKMQRMVNDGNLGKYDAIFTTYSQMQLIGGQTTVRNEFLQRFTHGNVIIFDESHLAGGGPPKIKNGVQLLDRARFARQIAGQAHSVMFSSATYAKRPDVMSLYATTDMRFAVTDIEKLADTVNAGGIPLQQVLSSMLTEAGQYIRRERSFEGVSFLSSVVPVNISQANNAAKAMDLVRIFDDYKQGVVSNLSDIIAGSGDNILSDGSIGGAGMSSSNFTSVMHNLINQMLLAFKAEAAVQEAIKSIKAGEKPVITVANTMGSFIEQFAAENALNPGDLMPTTFNDLLERYLERSRTVIEGSPFGQKTKRRLEDAELGPKGVQLFNNTMNAIRDMDFSGIPVSPIDHIKARLAQEGYSVEEITGRSHTIDYSIPGKPVYKIRSTAESAKGTVVANIEKYNSGELDVLILNQSGSTGLSIHASEKFKDQRPRHMIIAQPEANIDTFMQMLGRVFRTGQVVVPKYSLLMSDIPAEKRPGAVLSKKLASLNANTTASRTTDVGVKDSPDFMNDLGDQVAADFLWDNPELLRRLGMKRPETQEDGTSFKPDGLMRKFTGYIPLLPVQEQAELYDQLISDYNETLAQLVAMGENPLEARDLPLDAVTLSSMNIFQGDPGSQSPFSHPAQLETMDVKKIGKPYTSNQVRELVREGLGLSKDAEQSELEEAADEKMKELENQLNKEFEPYKASELSKYQDDDKRANRELSLDYMRDRVTDVFHRFQPGTTVTILSNENAFYGVVQDIEHKGKAQNPAALGTWRVTILVADSMKKITIPISKIGTKYNIVTNNGMTASGKSIMGLFDAGQSESREQRFMVTGNIFAGFDVVKKGQITHYTNRFGERKLGVLLPKEYNPAEKLTNIPVQLETVDHVFSFIGEGTGNRGIAKTADGIFFVQLRNGGVRFSAPQARTSGGRYFLNRAITDIAGRDFVSAGGRMNLDVTMNTARDIINMMISDQTHFMADAFKDEARSITGSTVGINSRVKDTADNDNSLLPDSSGAYSIDSTTSQGVTAAQLRSHFASVNTTANGGPQLIIVQSFRELPPHILKNSNQQRLKNRVRGIIDWKDNTIYLIADKLGTIEQAERTFLHEAVGHAGMASLIGEKKWNVFLDEVIALYGGRKGLKDIIDGYGFDPNKRSDMRRAASEKIARMAEANEKPGFLRRLYAAIREALRKMGFRVELSENDIKVMLQKVQERMMGKNVFGEFAQSPSFSLTDAAQKITETEAFKKWFGESKVVDENGDPLVVYHGTDKGFDEFRSISKTGFDEIGFHFGTAYQAEARLDAMSKRNAAEAGRGFNVDIEKDISGFRTMPLFLKIKNPLLLPDSGTWNAASIATALEVEPKASNLSREQRKKAIEIGYSANSTSTQELKTYFESLGFDGVKYRNKVEGGGDSYIAFHPIQIKSIFNRGTFDPDNPNISYSLIPDSISSHPVEFAKEEVSILKKTIVNTYADRTEAGAFQRLLRSPAWWKHPVLKRLYEIAGLERPERVHTILHDTLKLNDVLTPLNEIKKSSPKDYEAVNAALLHMDATGETWEDYRDNAKLSPEAFKAVSSVRELLDEALELQRRKVKEVIDILEGKGIDPKTYVLEDSGDEKITIWGMYQQMGSLKGSYFPRKREPGDWAVTSTAADGTPYREHFRTRFQAERASAQYRKEGRTNVSGAMRVEREPESVYQAINMLDMQKMIEQAMKRSGAIDPETEMLMKKELFGEVANLLKERGFRSSRMQRREGPPVKGFIEDPIDAVGSYSASLAGGIAKSEAAANMIREVREGLDERKDSARYDLAKEYIAEQLKNPDRADRMIALAKSVVTFKYLGFGPKTALVNTTSLLTSTPAAIHQYAMGGKGSFAAIGKSLFQSMKDYSQVMRGKSLPDAEEQAFMGSLAGGADLEQYTRDAMAHLAGAYGKSWMKVMEKAMWLFQKSENWVRGTTMLAAYRLAKQSGQAKTHEEAMKIAKDTSNKAHAVYNKASMPMWTMGSNPAAKIGQMGYTYMNFGHNYLQMLSDIGWSKKNYKAAAFALLSPAVLGGAGATIATPVVMAVAKGIMGAGGDDRDPEKVFAEMIRNSMGEDAEKAYRYGIFGILGMDISGSLSIGMQAPKNFTDLIGPFGGVAGNVAQAAKFASTGQFQKAGEELSPAFAANVSRAFRELSGATTRSGDRVWDENGKPYIPNTGETVAKMAGFRSARRATVEAQRWEDKKEKSAFGERKKKILDRYQAYLGGGTKDPEELQSIMTEVSEFNKAVRESGRAYLIPYITRSTMQREATNMKRPSGRELRAIRHRRTERAERNEANELSVF